MLPQRRSARLKEKPLQEKRPVSDAKSVEHDEDDDGNDYSEVSGREGARPRKRLKRISDTTNNQNFKKRRGGKLKKLPEMPLDILFDIFGHLLPYDLLRLSRATKALRGILMKRSSAFVWKRARGNIPSLPEPYPQLCEPVYANLAFDSHCHYCGAIGAKTVHWFFFKRACLPCQNKHMKSSYRHYYTLRDLVPGLGISPGRMEGITIDCLPVYHTTYLETELVDSLAAHAAIEDADERYEWRKNKKKEVMGRQEFADACGSWLSRWREGLGQVLAEAKARRNAAILERMKQEGWDDVVEELSGLEEKRFASHKLVKQNKDLTDRIWKNIKPAIVEMFTEFRDVQHQRIRLAVREKRLDAFENAFDSFCHTVPWDSVVAPMAHIVMMDAVQALIYDERLRFLPSDTDFQVAFSGIPEMTLQWKAKLDQHLSHLLASTGTEELKRSLQDVDVHNLHLAIALFECQSCGQSDLSYAQVLVHTHQGFREGANYSANIKTCFAGLGCRPTEPLEFKLVEQKYIRAILQACSLPENTTTMEDLEILDPILECVMPEERCSRKRRDPGHRHALPWAGFLSHWPHTRGIEPDPSNIRMLQHEDLLNKFIPDTGFYSYQLEDRHLFGCKHCYSPYAMPFDALKTHLSSYHGIEICSRESMEHYVIHPSVGRKRKSFNTLYAPVDPVLKVVDIQTAPDIDAPTSEARG